jgi:hypothetical protein
LLTSLVLGGSGVATSRPAAQAILPIVLIALAVAALYPLRVALNAKFALTTVKHDVYPLPPPQQTVALSLGYRAALADVIFAHVLVSYGLHFQEKRRFEFVGNYLDAINELDPTFEQPYRLADTLLTLQVRSVGPENYRKARSILERGMKQFPFDPTLWDSAGQFLAYLGPGALKDPTEQNEWRLAGGRALAHACDVAGNEDAVPYHCITAAGLLTHAGARPDQRRFLERILTVSDDPEIRALAAGALDSEARDRVEERYQRFQRLWGTDLPFVTRGAYLSIGPTFDAAACAGLGPTCATSWREWGAANELASAANQE